MVAEHFQGTWGNFRNVVTAAQAFKEPVHVFVGGKDPSKLAEAVAATKGVDKVLVS